MRDQRGFTLIELMVVILIIAMLIAIAVPTFLGARRRAQDTQAKSHLRAGLVAQKTFYANGAGYTDNLGDMQEAEGNLDWGNPDAAARGIVVEDVSGNAQGVVLHSLSRSGILFCIADLVAPFDYSSSGYPLDRAGTYYTRRDNADASSDCTGLVWEVTSSGWN